MSRIGLQPIPIPDKVKVSIAGQQVDVEGPVGKLSWTHRPEVTSRIDQATNCVLVTRNDDERETRALHGMTRAIIANMIEGCAKGYEKGLELYGVGYGVTLQGQKLSMNCGCSHPVEFDLPAGLSAEVTVAQARGDNDPARFVLRGPDKQLVGEYAARIRRSRPPEPYKGKGVRYAGERIRRKEGKAFAGAGAG